MRKRRLRDFLLYRIDRVLRSSFGVQVAGLALFTAAAIIIGGVLAHLVGLSGSWGETFWWTWLRFTDPGYVGQDSGWPLRVASILVTISGWVIFGLLISIFSTTIQDRLGKVRQGAQAVLERGHTIVLGWDNSIYSMLDQIWSSDEGDQHRAVVVLANRDKDEMERNIRRYCLVHRSRRTICRSGSIQSTVSLRNVGLIAAGQVLILGEGDDSRELADSGILKAVLACSQVWARSPAHLAAVTVVAAIKHAVTEQLVRPFLEDRTDRMDLMLVETSNVLARIIAQCAWQPGLALVYRDLLTYTGDLELGEDARSSEIYCLTAKEAGLPPGITFRQAIWGFERANLIGYQREQQSPLLNPLASSVLADCPLVPEDRLFLVADRRQDIQWTTKRDDTSPLVGQPMAVTERRILLFGSSQKTRTVLQELCAYLPVGSSASTTCPVSPDIDTELTIQAVQCDSAAILAGHLEPGGYDTIVLLEDDADPDRHDAHILTLMAALRAVGRTAGKQVTVVAELYDPRNRELAMAADVNDIVVSTELVSNFIVQVAREPERAAIFRELMDEQGNELHVRPVSCYCQDGLLEIAFADIMQAAALRGELAIGYLPKGAVRAELSPLDRWDRHPAAYYHQVVVISEN